MSRTVCSPTKTSAAEGDRAGLDHAGPGAVAGDVDVLADHGAGADRQQVGADRERAGEDHRAAADPGAQRPQVQRVQRGADGQPGQRVGRTIMVLTSQNRKYARLHTRMRRGFHRPISSHFATTGSDAHGQQPAAANDHQALVDAERPAAAPRPRPRRRPAPAKSRRRRRGRPAAAARRTARYRGLLRDAGAARRGRQRRRGGRGPARGRRRPGRPRRPAAHRRVQVDVLHRHRRQVAALADRRAEPGHQQRAGAEVVEEVAVGRDPVDAERPRPVPRRAPLGAGRRGDVLAAVGRDPGAGRRGQALAVGLVAGQHRDDRRAAPGRPGPCTGGSRSRSCASSIARRPPGAAPVRRL